MRYIGIRYGVASFAKVRESMNSEKEISEMEQELSEEMNDDSPSIPEELIETSDEETV